MESNYQSRGPPENGRDTRGAGWTCPDMGAATGAGGRRTVRPVRRQASWSTSAAAPRSVDTAAMIAGRRAASVRHSA